MELSLSNNKPLLVKLGTKVWPRGTSHWKLTRGEMSQLFPPLDCQTQSFELHSYWQFLQVNPQPLSVAVIHARTVVFLLTTQLSQHFDLSLSETFGFLVLKKMIFLFN